jgi:hypothetical protein
MPYHHDSSRSNQDTSMAIANNIPSKGISMPSAAPVVQLQKLIYATGDNYRMRVHQNSNTWMALIELDNFNGKGWHLSIFPSNQHTWRDNYQLPATGHKPVYSREWMNYDEFHLTSPEGKHFFYHENCTPMARGMQGESAPWGNPSWAMANYLVAYYFKKDMQWLNAYVSSQVEAKKQEKKDEVDEQVIWNAYKEAVKLDGSLANDGGYEKFKSLYQ